MQNEEWQALLPDRWNRPRSGPRTETWLTISILNGKFPLVGCTSIYRIENAYRSAQKAKNVKWTSIFGPLSTRGKWIFFSHGYHRRNVDILHQNSSKTTVDAVTLVNFTKTENLLDRWTDKSVLLVDFEERGTTITADVYWDPKSIWDTVVPNSPRLWQQGSSDRCPNQGEDSTFRLETLWSFILQWPLCFYRLFTLL